MVVISEVAVAVAAWVQTSREEPCQYWNSPMLALERGLADQSRKPLGRAALVVVVVMMMTQTSTGG